MGSAASIDEGAGAAGATVSKMRELAKFVRENKNGDIASLENNFHQIIPCLYLGGNQVCEIGCEKATLVRRILLSLLNTFRFAKKILQKSKSRMSSALFRRKEGRGPLPQRWMD